MDEFRKKRGDPVEEGGHTIQDMKGMGWKHFYTPGKFLPFVSGL